GRSDPRPRVTLSSSAPRLASRIPVLRGLAMRRRAGSENRARKRPRSLQMCAIVEAGGRQEKVAPGAVVVVDRLDVEPGAEVTFDRVLLIEGEDGTVVA